MSLSTSLPAALTTSLPAWHAALVIGPAVATAVASLAVWALDSTTTDGGTDAADTRRAWRSARWATAAALVCAVLSLAAVLAGSSGSGLGMRADAVGAVVMVLVSFVGWVIVRFSQPYLNGERQERPYVRWLLTTLASVGVVVATNHLLVLALAWMTTSVALHRLLTFFSDRPPAVLAAHKKFIVGRLADACMLGAAALLYVAFGTLHLDLIMASAAAPGPLPGGAQAAVLLVVCAALLKCAQLPFHGWLIQVMEAPTPVSALLHAGVVNLGGFVLMRLAPLVNETPAAQVLLVVVGAATAVLAALVMSTRISIKVMLAWSTCAQMGFMLMQCGLGLWALALLHLVAHSLYKAHAFLGAGGAVRRAQLVQLTPRAAAPGPLALLGGAVVGIGMTLAAGALVQAAGPALGAGPAPATPPAAWVLTGIAALALVPLVHAQALRLGGLWLPALGLGAFGVGLSYLGLHALLAAWLAPAPAMAVPAALWVGVAVAFGLLFVLQSAIAVAPQGRWARRLYPWFYGGLFLDERFSRIAFTLWRPPATPPLAVSAPALHASDTTTAPTTGAHA